MIQNHRKPAILNIHIKSAVTCTFDSCHSRKTFCASHFIVFHKMKSRFSPLNAINTKTLCKTFHQDSLLFTLPKTNTTNTCAVLIIVQEKLLQYSGATLEKEYVIKPISAEEYDRQMSKAYNKPLKRQAWRLFLNQSVGFDLKSEIIPRISPTGKTWKYKVRYIRRPRPIVLEALTDGLSIDGVTDVTECELNPILHMDILLKAVELAAASRGMEPAQQTRQE